ncbi:MAG TPA: hypothetical protein P5193_07710, partial [Microthrixaceae bacterium]|nr:hypothetical protein [Microthrixaceae bacterium]
MSGAELLLLLIGGTGVALVLDQFRWAHRRSMARRLTPYGSAGRPGPRIAAVSSPAAVLMPLVEQSLDRVTRALGIDDDLATRLARADVDVDPARFRTRQALHAVLGLAGGAALALLVRPGSFVSVLTVVGLPLLWVLL